MRQERKSGDTTDYVKFTDIGNLGKKMRTVAVTDMVYARNDISQRLKSIN